MVVWFVLVWLFCVFVCVTSLWWFTVACWLLWLFVVGFMFGCCRFECLVSVVWLARLLRRCVLSCGLFDLLGLWLVGCLDWMIRLCWFIMLVRGVCYGVGA